MVNHRLKHDNELQREDKARAVEEAKAAVDAARRTLEAKEASIRAIREENEAAENAMRDALNRKTVCMLISAHTLMSTGAAAVAVKIANGALEELLV